MRLGIVLIPLLAVAAVSQDIVADVRAAIAQKNFTLGESLIQRYKGGQGVTPEMIEALSWLGRGALAAGQTDRADAYAERTRKLALEQLAHRKLDSEPHLPLALGASIEVQAPLRLAQAVPSTLPAQLTGYGFQIVHGRSPRCAEVSHGTGVQGPS